VDFIIFIVPGVRGRGHHFQREGGRSVHYVSSGERRGHPEGSISEGRGKRAALGLNCYTSLLVGGKGEVFTFFL